MVANSRPISLPLAMSTDPKPQPNHTAYIRMLRSMTGEQRLAKAFELSARNRALFEQGLRDAFPHLSNEEFRKLLRERLELCHNQEY